MEEKIVTSFPCKEMPVRPLHFIWIANCSSSIVSNGKVQSLNTAIREAIPQIRDVARSNPNAQVFVRAIKFSSGANWHIAQPTPLEQFQWTDLKTGGASDVGSALKMVAEALKVPPMPMRGLSPVLVLVTDSKPTDDFEQGIKAIMDEPWGKKAVRIAIGIGPDADYNMLKRFIGNEELAPLQANNAQDLTNYIQWGSTISIPSNLLSNSPTINTTKENKTMGLPGGEMSARPLNFFWIADCSGSMSSNGKMQSLNTAIREAIPQMRDVARSNPNAQVFVRAIKFATGANWHVAQPTPLEQFQWTDLKAGGVTDMGKAFKMMAEQLKMPPMPSRGLPPVLVLITDGHPTDEVGQGIKAIMDEPWGKRAVRIAIGIGPDADYNMLKRFIGNEELAPLQANNAQDLTNYIKWASTAVLQSSSSPNMQGSDYNPIYNSPIAFTIPTPPSPTPAGQVPDSDIF